MAVKKFRSFDDFVPTISDSEEDVPDLDASDDEMEKKPVKSSKTKNKSKKKAKQQQGSHLDEDVHEDLNPEFQFSIDSGEVTTNFAGWDFQGDEKSDEVEKKDVDLDGIIRRKGGLIMMAATGSDAEESLSEESEEEPEEGDEPGESDDEDELALDGFGMGVKRKATEENEEDEEDEEEEDDDEDDDKKTEMSQADLGKGKDEDEDIEEDTKEEMAEFYAPEEESADAKKIVHKTFNSLSLSLSLIHI